MTARQAKSPAEPPLKRRRDLRLPCDRNEGSQPRALVSVVSHPPGEFRETPDSPALAIGRFPP
jgi:hypothetical protein